MGSPYLLRYQWYIHLNEYAFTWAHFCSLNHFNLILRFDDGQASRASRIVQCHTRLNNIGNSVFKLHKDVRTMIHAQAIARTQVLVNPHTHGCTLTNKRGNQEGEHQQISHNIVPANWLCGAKTQARTGWSVPCGQSKGKQHGKT